MRVPLASMVALLCVAGLAAPAGAQAPTPPLRIVGKAAPLTFLEGGASRTYYRVMPGKSLELATSGEMTLVVPARAIARPANPPPAITVIVTVPGAAPVSYRGALPVTGATVELSDKSEALPATMIRVPILAPAATVRIFVDKAPGAIVGFARMPAPGISAVKPAPTSAPTAMATATPPPVAGDPAPAPTDASIAAPGAGEEEALMAGSVPLPLIRRRVERLGLGPRIAYVVPAGPVDGGTDGSSNLFAGAELRFTPGFLERQLSFTGEGGVYVLRDVEPLSNTSPFGMASAGEVTVSTRIVPLLGGAVWRVKLGSDKRAAFAGANGGVVLTTRTEEVDFREPTRTSDTRLGAQGRIGFEQKVGPGRTVLEASYLHVTAGEESDLNDTYLGGAFVGMQYRLIF